MRESEVLHHHSIRKRVHVRHEPYPHPDRRKRIVDALVYVAGILGPLMAIPQLMDIFIGKNVAGLSLLTWSLWAFLNIFWILYGILHKERPIIITYIMWLVVNLAIVIGILLYR